MSVVRKPEMLKNNNNIQKAQDLKGTLKKFIKYLKVDLKTILIAIIFTIISVVSLVIIPEVLGDATDIIISGIVQKNVNEKVNETYKSVNKNLQNFDEIKNIVKDINENYKDDENLKKALDRNLLVEAIYSRANEEDSAFDEETKNKIKQIPKEFRMIPLRAFLGYEFQDRIEFKPIYETEVTFREFLERVEVEYDFNLDGNLKEYFLNMKINSKDGYQLNVDYNSSKTIGEFIKKLNCEDMYDIPKAYKSTVYNTPLNESVGIDTKALLNKIYILIALVVIYSISAYMQGYILAIVGQRVSYRFRKDITSKINKLPMSYFDKTSNGEIMSLISNDVDSISNALNQSFAQVITAIGTIVGVIIMMLRIKPILALVAIISVPLSILLMRIIINVGQKHFINQQENLAKVNKEIEEKFAGQEVVKLFNGEEKEIELFEKYNDELCKSTKSSQFISGLMQPISKFIGNLGYVVICIFGGSLVVKELMSIGNLQSFVQYVRQFNQPVNQISSVTNMIQATMASAERIFKLLDEKEIREESNEDIIVKNGSIVFNNVDFSYINKDVIKNFNLICNEKDTIAIVGPTGAGKTSLMKILLRYYDINSGCIEIDNQDISKYTRSSLRSNIGIVLQDAILFNGSIKENIRFGNLDASDEDIYNAAKIAKLDSFLPNLEEDLNNIIDGENCSFSQGQKQLITIARAIVGKKKIMIFDEATSSIDTKTEQLVQEAMDAILKESTSFVIAHRLSTIENADKIIVVNDGNIIETGTHKELIKKRGFYYDLYQAQFSSI